MKSIRFLIIATLVALPLSAMGQQPDPMDGEDPPPMPADPAPAAGPAPAPAPAPAAPAPAPAAAPATAAAPAGQGGYWDVNFARFNRMAFTVGFGLGNANVDDIHTLAEMGGNSDTSSMQINAELSLRYYAPYYGLVQVGYGAVYNWMDELQDNHNLVMEVPILFGGYYPFLGRLCAYGGIGPSIFFYRRSFWDPGVDFKTDGGVGMQLMVGGEIFLSEHFAFGMELRYRHLPGKVLKEKDDRLVSGINLSDYEMNLSGISWGIQFRFFAM